MLSVLFRRASAQSATPHRHMPCLIAVLQCSREYGADDAHACAFFFFFGSRTTLSPSEAKGFANRLGPVQKFDLSRPVRPTCGPASACSRHETYMPALEYYDGEMHALSATAVDVVVPLLVPPPFPPGFRKLPRCPQPHILTCVLHALTLRRSRIRAPSRRSCCLQLLAVV